MSTDEQATLGDYSAPSLGDEASSQEEDEAAQRPSWTPNGGAVRECQNCGAHVAADWGRVLGDQDNTAHGCLDCRSIAEIAGGAAGDPDYEHYHDRGESYR